MKVLNKVAQVMTRKYNLSVKFVGSGARTDGHTIYLPALPENLSDDVVNKIRGYCDHEQGHIEESDFSILYRIADMENAGQIKSMTNLLEDVRIENKQAKKHAGVKENLVFLTNTVFTEEALDFPLNQLAYEARRNVCGFDLKGADKSDEVMGAFGADIFDRIAALESSEDSLNLALAILDEVKEARDIKEAEKKAKEEAEAKEKEDKKKEEKGDLGDKEDGTAEPSEKEPETPSETPDNDRGDDKDGEAADDSPEDEGGSEGDSEGDGSDEGADGNSKDGGDDSEGSEDEGEGSEGGDDSEGSEGDSEGSEGEDEGEGGKGEGGEGEDDGDGNEGPGGDDAGMSADNKGDEGAEDSEVEGGKAEGGGKDDGDGGKADFSKGVKLADLSPEDFEKMIDIAKEVSGELKDLHAEAADSDEYMVLDSTKDIEEVVKEARDTDSFDKLKEKVPGLNMMRAKIGSMFQARTASRWMSDREEGKLNARALSRVATGYKNIFREKYVSDDQDTAVSFLVDFSSSMGGNITMAMQAVIAFMEVLSGGKIRSEVLGYTTRGLDHVDIYERRIKRTYGRVERLVTYIFKTFAEPYNLSVKKRISNYNNLYMNQNCDPDSVLVAFERLVRRPEKRKILFVLTDGVVSNHGNCSKGQKYLKKIVPEIEKAGVEIIGLAIGNGACAEVAEYYPKNIQVPNSNELAETMVIELKKIMKV